MDFLNFFLGVLLIILSLLWLMYELDESSNLKRKKRKMQLALQPRFYLGVFIVFAFGITLIIKSFKF